MRATRRATRSSSSPVGPVHAEQHGAVARRAARLEPSRERAAGERHDLQRPHDPAPVAGQHRRRGGGVDGGQAGVQRRRSDGGQLRLQLRAQHRIGARELQLVHHRLHVQPRAADQHRGATGAAQVLDDRPRRPLVGRDGGGLGDVQDVEQVVRNAGALGGARLGRADVHPPVEGHRVGVDDLPAQGRGELDAEAGLARRGGPDHGDQRRRTGRRGDHRPRVAGWSARRGRTTAQGDARPEAVSVRARSCLNPRWPPSSSTGDGPRNVAPLRRGARRRGGLEEGDDRVGAAPELGAGRHSARRRRPAPSGTPGSTVPGRPARDSPVPGGTVGGTVSGGPARGAPDPGRPARGAPVAGRPARSRTRPRRETGAGSVPVADLPAARPVPGGPAERRRAPSSAALGAARRTGRRAGQRGRARRRGVGSLPDTSARADGHGRAGASGPGTAAGRVRTSRVTGDPAPRAVGPGRRRRHGLRPCRGR